MSDHVTKAKRSEIMRRVKGKHTTPEMTIRKLIFSLGYRYRLHKKNLPGSPDIVFPGRKKVIYVNGCFWHFHGCSKGRIPKSNVIFWTKKLKDNEARDKRNQSNLKELGWSYLIV